MQSQVIEEVAKHLGVTPQDIDAGSSLSDDLGLGPVELADLLDALSQKFNVNFNPSEVEGLKTVSDIIVMVEDLSLE
jgi:acyl carrier protein